MIKSIVLWAAAAAAQFSLIVTKSAERNFTLASLAAQARWRLRHASSSKMNVLLEGEAVVPAMPLVHDEGYVSEVLMGTPPQKMSMILDTGSSDVWVQSTETTYDVKKEGPWAPRYDANSSRTAEKVEDASWKVEYLDGTSAGGSVYRDILNMSSLTLTAPIEVAEFLAPRFENDISVSGIMGLARTLPNNIQPPMDTFLSELKKQLKRPVFGVDLRRNATSRFTFGYVETDKELTWLDTVPSSPYWDIQLDMTLVDKTWRKHLFDATVDTGTSLMYLPDTLVSHYWNSVSGSRLESFASDTDAYMFPCNLTDLPSLSFKLKGGQVLRVPGPTLNYTVSDGNPGFCWGGVQSANTTGVAVLGDVFLKAVHAVFDLDGDRVGFADKLD